MVKKVNHIRAEQLIQTYQCAKGERLEVVGFPMSIKYGSDYSRMDQIKFFKGCLPQIPHKHYSPVLYFM